MTLQDVKNLRDALNKLTVQTQALCYELDEPIDVRVDDEFIPFIMDAIDILNRIIEEVEEQ